LTRQCQWSLCMALPESSPATPIPSDSPYADFLYPSKQKWTSCWKTRRNEELLRSRIVLGRRPSCSFGRWTETSGSAWTIGGWTKSLKRTASRFKDRWHLGYASRSEVVFYMTWKADIGR
jgi:hypothetical protein